MNRSLFRYFSCDYLKTFQKIRHFSVIPYAQLNLLDHDFEVDEDYFRNEANQKTILKNIQLRDIKDDYPRLFRKNITSDELSEELIAEAKNLPNTIHPLW